MTSTAVRVALRVRPLTDKEVRHNCTECLTFIPNEPQILIGTDKSFTYDYVFDTNADQAQVYENAASPLLQKFIDGFNATILAYGQTGSGKTFSMGTSLDHKIKAENEGIVPRCITELFEFLKSREAQDDDYKFEIHVSFVELYNEEFIDLLNVPHQLKRKISVSSQTSASAYNSNYVPTEVTIREDIAGNIYWCGVREEVCNRPEDVLGFLAQGSISRSTGATDMNSVSSRSHAIFSIILKQQKPEEENGKRIIKTLKSKFHFVDLAGSERLKRTNAQGDRVKEGIAINSGLLALGNVISALGDEARRATHIPYRDSKLTRFLQDSLGGNSQTLMLACVSPADINFLETLNTLKYANRARNIKNRVVVNQDFGGSSIEVNQLKALVSRLRMEIATLHADGNSSTTTTITGTSSHFAAENNQVLKSEYDCLRTRLKDMSTQLAKVTSERDTLLLEREFGEYMQNEDEENILENINLTKDIKNHPIIEKYQNLIQELNMELEDTKTKVKSLETTQANLNKTVAIQQQQLLFQQQHQQFRQVSNSVLQKFSHVQPKNSSSSSNRRRKFGGKIVSNTSATRNAVKIATKSFSRRPTKSTSNNRQKKQVRIKKSRPQKIYYYNQEDDEYEDEGYVNDVYENIVRHEEIKESIAKVRADIRKSLQVLELVKPLENSSEEEELKDFGEERNEIVQSPSDEGNYSLESSIVEDYAMADPTFDEQMKNNDDPDFYQTMDKQSKYNPQLCRMLQQIQSDIKVKEELLSHLEKTETEFTFMKRKFDEKIIHLQSQLVETQKEKDIALLKVKSTGTPRGVDKQNAEIRHAYETKMKSLMTEIQELKRKYSQATTAMQSNRSQNEALLRSLKVNVETLKVEKKRLMQRMKLESDRVREQMSRQERKIQQLQRQHAKSTQVKKRLERENEQQKHVLKKKNEEAMMNSNQIKQLTSIMKKAVREGGILDEKMLNSLAPILGGQFAVIARGGGHGFPRRNLKRRNPIPLEIRVSRKKELLDKALYQYIQGKQAVVEMEQLLVRRERLVIEKIELEEERNQVYHVEKEHEENTGQPMDVIAIELMDERMDLISAEISYLSARIRSLQAEAAQLALEEEENDSASEKTSSPRLVKHVTFVDEIVTEQTPNDEWADVDSFEEQYSVPTNAAPEIAYEVAAKLIKSFENDECKRIIENLIDDIMDLKMNEYNQHASVKNLEQTVIELRRELITRKKDTFPGITEDEQNLASSSNYDEDMIDMMIQEDAEHDYLNHGNLKTLGNMKLSTSSLYRSDLQYRPISLPNSPVASPSVKTNAFPTLLNESTMNKGSISYSNSRLSIPRMVDSINKSTSMLTRNSTPSPDRFYNMIQKPLSWQQRVGNEDTIIEEDVQNINCTDIMDSPTDFDHYVSDRESSTSTIRSSHLRRSSIQSESSLFTCENNRMNGIRRDLSRTSSFLSHLSTNSSIFPLEQQQDQNSPIYTSSCQPQHVTKRPFPPPVPSATTLERPTTPSVFDRLAQTPTRSSRAKRNYRHSSGSIDEIRGKWDFQRPISAMSGNYL